MHAAGRVRTARRHRHHVHIPGAAQLPPSLGAAAFVNTFRSQAMIRPRQVWLSWEKPLAKVLLLQAIPR